jgi:hypothetical protein
MPKIRVKETFSKVKAGLPWELPRQLIGDLVAYIVSCLNIRRTTALGENICPKVLFTGLQLDSEKELHSAFRDYVGVYEGTTDTMVARSAACIALHPAANVMGSWVLWKIEARSRVRCSNMKFVTTKSIVNAMNAIASKDDEIAQRPAQRLLESIVA